MAGLVPGQRGRAEKEARGKRYTKSLGQRAHCRFLSCERRSTESCRIASLYVSDPRSRGAEKTKRIPKINTIHLGKGRLAASSPVPWWRRVPIPNRRTLTGVRSFRTVIVS